MLFNTSIFKTVLTNYVMPLGNGNKFDVLMMMAGGADGGISHQGTAAPDGSSGSGGVGAPDGGSGRRGGGGAP